MKTLITNNLTGETIEVEVEAPINEIIDIPQPQEPTQEQVIEDLVALLIESGVITSV